MELVAEAAGPALLTKTEKRQEGKWINKY